MQQVKKARKSRVRRMKVSALNIAIQDRDLQKAASYRDLFIALAGLNEAVRYQGESRLLLSGVWEDENDDHRMLGVLDRFTDLDAFQWYNRDARRLATPEERATITVPAAMRANYRAFYVLLDLRKHKLVFLSYEASTSLSAKQVAFVFRHLLENPHIFERFGSVGVSIMQEPAALDRILNAPNLRYLSIEVNKPNGSFGGLDEDFEDQMEALQAKRLKYEVVADDRGSIQPDETIRKAAAVALSDGVVEGRIFENGITEPISTQQYPVSETITYSPDNEPQLSAFKRAASIILGRLAKVLKRQ
ncbi:MAG TPA: DUF4747 family protein [Xanthomonadales bacterium]|nr:DUF4747 family protein [Xanthomonadales bacterium]